MGWLRRPWSVSRPSSWLSLKLLGRLGSNFYAWGALVNILKDEFWIKKIISVRNVLIFLHMGSYWSDFYRCYVFAIKLCWIMRVVPINYSLKFLVWRKLFESNFYNSTQWENQASHFLRKRLIVQQDGLQSGYRGVRGIHVILLTLAC